MLALEGVTARYGRITALSDVSLTVAAAEFVCLIGANGAGKSTTLKAISGLVPAVAGRIRFDGQDIQGLPAQEILKRGIAHCPEGRRVFPYMTVDENLAMGAYVRRDHAGVAADLARVFAHFPILAERRRQPAGTLSGGEQQMLAIGRAVKAATSTPSCSRARCTQRSCAARTRTRASRASPPTSRAACRAWRTSTRSPTSRGG